MFPPKWSKRLAEATSQVVAPLLDLEDVEVRMAVRGRSWEFHGDFRWDVTRPGKTLTKNDGKIHHAFFMGKSTISMTIFNSFLFVYQRVYSIKWIIIPLNPMKSQLNLIKWDLNGNFMGFIFVFNGILDGIYGGIRIHFMVLTLW